MGRRHAAAALGAALLAGCAPATHTSTEGVLGATAAPARAAPGPPALSVSCSTSPSADPQPGNAGADRPLPSQLTVTGARLCRQLVVARPGRGTWEETVTYDVVGGLDTLVRAYQRPDGPVGNGVCSAVGHIPLFVTFTTSRGDVEAREPRGRCGEPVQAAVRAYQVLRVREVRSVWGQQVSSQRALDSGCAEQWKDMLAVERDRTAATAAPAPHRPSSPCASTATPHQTAAEATRGSRRPGRLLRRR